MAMIPSHSLLKPLEATRRVVMTSHKVILLTGIPGSGKSEFARWLQQRGWTAVESDPFYRGATPRTAAEEAWARFILDGQTSKLRALIAASSGPLIVEWGFPVSQLALVRRAIGLGMEGWWFDGDIEACHTAWRQVHSADDEFDWQRHVPTIKPAWQSISAAFEARILRVVEPGPTWLVLAA